MPIAIVVIFFGRRLYVILRSFLQSKSDEEKTEIANKLLQAMEKRKVPIEDLKKIKPIVFFHIWRFIQTITAIFMVPVIFVRFAIILRWGVKLSWKLPVTFYEVYQLMFLAISYYYSYHQSPIIGMVISILVGTCAFEYIIRYLERDDKGNLKILSRASHKLNIKELIEQGLIVVISFASFFYAISVLYPSSFSSKLTILDSIYFSIITATTVGYGDISPISNLAKLFVMFEILFGMLYILFVVSMFLSVFIKRQSDEVSLNSPNSEK